jgi:hypothetical protein
MKNGAVSGLKGLPSLVDDHLSWVLETVMGMKASEVGGWLRQRAGKRDHREVLSGDYLVIRPGPNFHLLNPAPARSPSAPEHDPPSQDSHKDRADGGR